MSRAAKLLQQKAPVVEADVTHWVMNDDLKDVLKDAQKYVGHGADIAHQEGATELRLILDAMRVALIDLENSRDPSSKINDIAVSLKILKKAGHLK